MLCTHYIGPTSSCIKVEELHDDSIIKKLLRDIVLRVCEGKHEIVASFYMRKLTATLRIIAFNQLKMQQSTVGEEMIFLS